MRTTLEIDDDVMLFARDLAKYKQQGIGKTISDLARRGLVPDAAPTVELRDGIPVWVHGSQPVTVTNELVRNLMDDE